MATIEGTHQHATSGRRYRFKATYHAAEAELHWSVEWFRVDGSGRQTRSGTIPDAVFIAFPHRAVIEQVIDAINAS